VNIVDTIMSIAPFDWFATGFIVLMFILGYAQGAIRRLLGIASIAFSFLLASQLRDSLGSFLASSWTQWPREYDFMLAFGFLFVLGGVIFTIVIQVFYKHASISESHPLLDELAGGLLGIVEALLMIGAGIVVLDSFFRAQVTIGDNQIRFLKDLYGAVNASGTARVFRETLLPVFITIVGPLVPADIRALFQIH
jgi:uncharacterized membrane protein required for colicin V production